MLRIIEIRSKQQAFRIFDELLLHLVGWCHKFDVDPSHDTFKKQLLFWPVVRNLVTAYGARLECDGLDLQALFY